MESLSIFLIILVLTFGFMTVIWTTRGLDNTLIKVLFFVLTIWAIFLLAVNNGYMVKEQPKQPATQAPTKTK